MASCGGEHQRISETLFWLSTGVTPPPLGVLSRVGGLIPRGGSGAWAWVGFQKKLVGGPSGTRPPGEGELGLQHSSAVGVDGGVSVAVDPHGVGHPLDVDDQQVALRQAPREVAERLGRVPGDRAPERPTSSGTRLFIGLEPFIQKGDQRPFLRK